MAPNPFCSQHGTSRSSTLIPGESIIKKYEPVSKKSGFKNIPCLLVINTVLSLIIS